MAAAVTTALNAGIKKKAPKKERVDHKSTQRKLLEIELTTKFPACDIVFDSNRELLMMDG